MIEKYLNREFIISIFIILLGLIALFAFFDFMQEINDLGKGNYGLLQVFTYVLLSKIFWLLYKKDCQILDNDWSIFFDYYSIDR